MRQQFAVDPREVLPVGFDAFAELLDVVRSHEIGIRGEQSVISIHHGQCLVEFVAASMQCD